MSAITPPSSHQVHLAHRSADVAIRVEGVDKRFGQTQVLRQIDLVVGHGERLVVCGPSGSGKSTLIRAISGLETIDAGQIRVAGEVGMVFQQFNLFPHLSALANCTLALVHARRMSTPQAREWAMHFLQQVHMADKAAHYPAELSGGQQQRVAIARALCLNPSVLLFDEPTSALDPEMVQEVLDTMEGLANDGITMVCVTHEMEFARVFADRVVFMDAGQIVVQTSASQFFDTAEQPRVRQFLARLSRARRPAPHA